MRDKIKDIIENPNLNRTEVIDRLTELFESANAVEPIVDDTPYVPVDKDFIYADQQNNKERSDDEVVYNERYSMDDIEEEEPPVPVFSKEDMIKILGDLTWSEYEDKHFIIRNQIKDTEPYYNSSSLHISEDRYIIGGERYRTMWAIGGNDYTIEKLIDSSNCLHKNTHKNVCYDCDKEITD